MDQKSLQRLARGGNKVGLGQGKNLLGLDMGASVRAEAEAARQRYGEPEGGRIGIAYQGPNPGRTPFEVNANATLMAFGMNPNLKRFTFLPYARNPETGTGELALPQVGYDFLRDAQMPGEMLKGTPVTQEEMRTAAMNIIPNTSTIGGMVGHIPQGALAANAIKIREGRKVVETVPYDPRRHGRDYNQTQLDAMQDGRTDIAQYQQHLNAAANRPQSPGAFVDDTRVLATSILDGDEIVPNKGPVIGIGHNGGPPIDGYAIQGQIGNQKQAARYLDERYKAMGLEPITEYTPENIATIASRMAEEAAAALQRSGHAGDWYSSSVKDAMTVAKMTYPEMQTLGGESAYKSALAFTSNGIDVGTNVELADAAFDFFRKNGRMPENAKELGRDMPGKAGPTVFEHMSLYNELLKASDNDPEVLYNTLMQKMPVKEIKKKFGVSISGEPADAVVPLSAMFGPKIGAGFWQNLHGNWDWLTADRWWMKTWGRYVGRSEVRSGLDRVNDQKAAFVEAARRDPNFKKDFGVSAAAIKDNPDLLFDIAEKAFSRYEKSGFEDKTDVNKTAKNLMDKFISVSESPDQYGGVDIRPTMRSAADQALNLLKSKGIKLTMADLQAILWYPEKDVWAALTRESAKSAPTDYRTEMIKLAQRKHGLTDQQIQQAIGKK